MNCFEARRALLTDPARLPSTVATHVEQCERCGRVASQIRTLDLRVADALNVDPPVGLTERLKLAGPRRPRWLAPSMAGMALAASVLVATIVIGWPAPSTVAGADWAGSVVSHTEYDAAHELTANPAAPADFQHVIERLGGQVRAIPEGLTRAGYCILEGRAALHAVIERAGQRFVVYVMPGVSTAETHVDLRGWRGEIISGENVAIAVIGRDATDDIEPLMKSLAASVQWSGTVRAG